MAGRSVDPVDTEPRRMTAAEWSALPEDEPGELVGGLLEEEEVPDYAHEIIISWFLGTLRSWLVPLGGFVTGSGAKFQLAVDRGRIPDASAYFPGSPKPPLRGPIIQPPDLAIEVLSPDPRDGRRDRIEKVDDYASFGIRWYWIVDPELRTLEVLELDEHGRYVHAAGGSEGVLEDVPGCEGLTLDLDDLWAEVDRLSASAEEPAGSEDR